MPLVHILAQDIPVATLRGLLADGRLPHALLFHGPTGVGKTTAAWGLAQAMVCESKVAQSAEPPEHEMSARTRSARRGEQSAGTPRGRSRKSSAPPETRGAATQFGACGMCRACRLIATFMHPDVLVVVPAERDEAEGPEDIGPTLERIRRALDARVKEEFYEPRYAKAASIGIGVVRFYVQAELAKKPVEAARRVVIVSEADRLTQSAQNALLKTLEEPPAFAHLVLVTSRPEALADTIRSRCRGVRFQELPRETLAALIVERTDVAKSHARLVAGLAGGSVPRAARLAGESLKDTREDALALVRAARRPDAREAARLARAVAPTGERDRDRLVRLAQLALLWYEDVLLAWGGAPDEALAHADLAKEIRAEAATLDAGALVRRIRALEEMQNGLERNLLPKILVADTILKMAGAGERSLIAS
jgi:DNA polymerase-3 subunit delta'